MKYVFMPLLAFMLLASPVWARKKKEDSLLTQSIENIYRNEVIIKKENKLEEKEKNELYESVMRKRIKKQVEDERAAATIEINKAVSARDKAEAELSRYEQEIIDQAEMDIRMSELRRLEKQIFKK